MQEGRCFQETMWLLVKVVGASEDEAEKELVLGYEQG